MAISAFHKHIKIGGSIGEKEKLSYVTLLKQRKKGKDKGYSDKKIMNAVIKAIFKIWR